jgi:predicted metal-dependent phosphoesterase TrpH
MAESLNVELHSHTFWSKDCVVPFEAILRICEMRKIDRIAITDHNTTEGALRMQKLAPDRVIVGEEIMTTKGELLGYFMTQSVPAGLSPKETIARLRGQGAAISVSHPFDQFRKGAWDEPDLRDIMHLVDAIEIFNARCILSEDNRKATQFAKTHGLLGTAGSDAHSRVEYGRTLTQLAQFHDAQSFLESLKQANYVERYSAFYVHLHSSTAKWSRKLGLRKREWAGG